jgi:hypothetical protein
MSESNKQKASRSSENSIEFRFLTSTEIKKLDLIVNPIDSNEVIDRPHLIDLTALNPSLCQELAIGRAEAKGNSAHADSAALSSSKQPEQQSRPPPLYLLPVRNLKSFIERNGKSLNIVKPWLNGMEVEVVKVFCSSLKVEDIIACGSVMAAFANAAMEEFPLYGTILDTFNLTLFNSSFSLFETFSRTFFSFYY